MGKILSILSLVVQLFPMIITLVKSVEEAIPGAGNGKEKLNMVRVALEAAFQSPEDLRVPLEQDPTIVLIIQESGWGSIRIESPTKSRERLLLALSVLNVVGLRTMPDIQLLQDVV